MILCVPRTCTADRGPDSSQGGRTGIHAPFRVLWHRMFTHPVGGAGWVVLCVGVRERLTREKVGVVAVH